MKTIGLYTCGDCRIRFRVVDDIYAMREGEIDRCAECGQRARWADNKDHTRCYVEDNGDDEYVRGEG